MERQWSTQIMWIDTKKQNENVLTWVNSLRVSFDFINLLHKPRVKWRKVERVLECSWWVLSLVRGWAEHTYTQPQSSGCVGCYLTASAVIRWLKSCKWCEVRIYVKYAQTQKISPRNCTAVFTSITAKNMSTIVYTGWRDPASANEAKEKNAKM